MKFSYSFEKRVFFKIIDNTKPIKFLNTDNLLDCNIDTETGWYFTRKDALC